MRYLGKRGDSAVVADGLVYEKDAAKIRDALRSEQDGYCAYSECWIRPGLDAHDVEHFDPRLKGTARDGYRNWYAVLHKLNLEKPRKIEPFLPILDPATELSKRIRYVHGHFEPIDADDVEARHLIEFLGWNKWELSEERRKHVKRVKRLLELGETWSEVAKEPLNLSYATALEAELGLEVPARGPANQTG